MVTGERTVVVNSTGQLGIVMSSARYKRDIHDMDEASSGLLKLRPVTFRYKQRPGRGRSVRAGRGGGGEGLPANW